MLVQFLAQCWTCVRWMLQKDRITEGTSIWLEKHSLSISYVADPEQTQREEQTCGEGAHDLRRQDMSVHTCITIHRQPWERRIESQW